MRIVDRATFFTLPKGTVYAKYMPCVFEDLCIKDDTGVRYNDWYYQQIVDAVESESSNEWADKLFDAQENGTSMPMDFDCTTRDGLYEDGQLFAVWEPQDVRGLIHRLHRALADVEGATVTSGHTGQHPSHCGMCAAVSISAELGIDPNEPVPPGKKARFDELWNIYRERNR